MTDPTNSSNTNDEQFNNEQQGSQFSPTPGAPGSAPQTDFGASAPANDDFSTPAAPAGDQYGAPAGDQYGAPAGDQFGAPAGGQQFSAPAGDQYGAPAGGQQFSAPAADQYGAPAGGQQFSAPAADPYGAPAGDQYGQQPNYGAPAGDQYGQQQFGAPGQPQYGAVPGQPQVSPQEEVEQSKNAHMFSAIAAIFGAGWIVALIFYLTQKDKGPFVRQETGAALNFYISIGIYMIASSILMFIFIGFLTYFAAWIMGIIFGFVSANKVGNGGVSNYPLAIKMIK